MAKFTVTFSVQGYITQTVEMSISLTADDLNSGRVATSIQENGDLIITATGEVIGKVLKVFNECEYEDFEVQG